MGGSLFQRYDGIKSNAPTSDAVDTSTSMSAISRQQKTKGEGFLIEAEKTLAKKTWFASSTEQKHEEAAELYEKAANAFKVGGCHAQAGDAYSKAAEIHRDQLKQLGEASKCLSSAGKLFRGDGT